ncbi:MAG TPA: cation diffusion facilitator family transporter [Bacteroidales bacterium]|nr:cation diffusion facilitator family transporter [Bacteroidales bacterium]
MIQEKNRVAFLSVIAAFFLTAFKFIVGFFTGSLGIISEALHSGLDLAASLITLFSVRVSDKPADKGHNYGHGKIENLSALFQTVLLLVTCIWIIYEAVDRLTGNSILIEVNAWSYGVVITSILIDFSRSSALYRVARKFKSQALEADALHFSTDIWSSGVVLLGLVSSDFGFFFADSIAALLVSCLVLLVSYRLGKQAVAALIDTAPEGMRSKVRNVISSFPEIKYIHSLKIRTSGAYTFIKFNIHLDPAITLKNAHEICDKIELELKNSIPRCEIYIHAEPQDKHHLIKDRLERVLAHSPSGQF